VAETRRALIWGAGLPVLIVLAALVHPAALALVLVYLAQVLRLAARKGLSRRISWEWAVFTVLGKFAEAQGVLRFHARRLLRRRANLIEYR